MATVYVSPLGGGNSSGASASNALPVTSLDEAIQLAGPGGTVVMLADKGDYNLTDTITLTHGGSASAAVTIVGQDSAGHEENIVINGTRPQDYSPTNPSGNLVFKLMDGADNLVFENMTFNDVGVAIRVAADVSNITIRDMEATNVQRFFEDCAASSEATATISGLTIENVEVHGFSKGVVRLQYDTHDVTISNVFGDSEYEDGDGLAMGIHLDGTVHNVVISDSTMENCISTNTDYTNGDGFASELGVYNVQYIRCSSIGNADGGFDLKSSETTLTDCYAEDNKRNYRLWGDNVTLTNCEGVDPHKHVADATGSQANIWVDSGAHNIQVIGGYYVDSGSATDVVHSDGGDIHFSGTTIWHASSGGLQTGSHIYGIDLSLVHSVSATGSYSTNGEQYLPTSSVPPPPPPPPPPPSLELSSASVQENSCDGTCVGYVSVPGATSGATYSLSDCAGGCFAIDPATGELMVADGSLLDFETASKTTITVQAVSRGVTYTQTFDISVLNQNEAPDGMSVTGGTVAENSAAGTLVARATGHDPDGGDTLSYSLSDNAGGLFAIDSKTGAIVVASGATLDYERQANYNVTVVVTDARGLSYSQDVVIGIKDVAEGLTNKTWSGSSHSDVFSPTVDANYSVISGKGDDKITTLGGNDIILGGSGDDTISSGGGNDTIRFSSTGDGFDWVDGGSGYDVIEATGKGTVIGLHSLSGIEEIRSNGYSSVAIAGSFAADTLDFSNVTLNGITKISGGSGNDTLTGNGVGNVICGDAGADRLTGGEGTDVFGYRYASDSTLSAHDTITDFTAGADRIDLSLIDAASKTRGDQAFTFIGDSGFTGVAGQLRVDSSDANVTHIYGDVNGDRVADFVIDILGSVQLHSSDFIL